MNATELDREHHGWLIRYELAPPDDSLPGPTHRTITFGGIRRWTYQGKDRVGLLALESGQPWRGTEYHVPASTEVRLERHIKRGVPRPRKTDYPVLATEGQA